MAISHAVLLKDAKLDAEEAHIGSAPTLELWSGSVPTNADTSIGAQVLLATGVLPSDWMANAGSGVKSKTGSWSVVGTVAAGSGTAASFFRLKTSGGVTKVQGTVSVSGGGGDMTLDVNSISTGQSVNVATYDLTGGN